MKISIRLVWGIIFCLFLIDTGYSFLQHYGQPLDGDLANLVLPTPAYQKALEDPFGFTTFISKEYSVGTNRYFSHFSIYHYFNNIPYWLQQFVPAIDSVYFANAIFKILIQLAVTISLGLIMLKTLGERSNKIIFAIVFIFPLIQNNGYNRYMGIIDHSISYTFFYAFPVALLLLFLLPFWKVNIYDSKFKLQWWQHLFLICLLFILPFSSPLIQGIVGVGVPLFFLRLLWLKVNDGENWPQKIRQLINQVPNAYLFYFISLTALCLYSLYIGQFNLENQIAGSIPIWERYTRMPIGIFGMLTNKLGITLLILTIVFNLQFLKRIPKDEKIKSLIDITRWLVLFSVFYLLLLPIGGYRPYRYYIVRYDLVMPIILCFILIWGYTAFYLTQHLSGRLQRWYISYVVIVLLIFTAADGAEFDKNSCERLAIRKIVEAKVDPVFLQEDCSVAAWEKTLAPELSMYNAEVLVRLGVLKDKKLYYQK